MAEPTVAADATAPAASSAARYERAAREGMAAARTKQAGLREIREVLDRVMDGLEQAAGGKLVCRVCNWIVMGYRAGPNGQREGGGQLLFSTYPSRLGYPVYVSQSGVANDTCADRAALELTLETLLASPSLGESVRSVLVPNEFNAIGTSGTDESPPAPPKGPIKRAAREG